LFKGTPLLKKFYWLGEKLPEYKKFQRWNVQVCALPDWECDGITGEIYLITISLPYAEALDLIGLANRPGISQVCSFIQNDDAAHITVFGSNSLALFLKEATEHVKGKFPDYRLPWGLDTELLLNPRSEKFKKFC
jgi:hypothetical protein